MTLVSKCAEVMETPVVQLQTLTLAAAGGDRAIQRCVPRVEDSLLDWILTSCSCTRILRLELRF